MFTNILGSGAPKNEKEALGGLRPVQYRVYIPAGTADIPGDGNTPIVFTTTKDIGRFVAASIDLDKWPEVLGMVGERTTWNKLVDTVEKIMGKKITRKYTGLEEMRQTAKSVSGANPFVKFHHQVSWIQFFSIASPSPLLTVIVFLSTIDWSPNGARRPRC